MPQTKGTPGELGLDPWIARRVYSQFGNSHSLTQDAAMASATDTPPTSRRATRPDPTRRLWQVPVFLLGLTAFLAVYNGWFRFGPGDPAVPYRVDLARLRAAAEKLTPDTIELEAALKRVAAEAGAFPELAPESHFVLGSGYVRLAELTADLTQARGYWSLARQHFDAVRAEQITDPLDAPRFAFRAAKARAADLPSTATLYEIEQARNQLAHGPLGEDAGDAPRLLAELSLRLVPPDLKRAHTGLTVYIAEAGLATPAASLARAKLRLSQVCLELHDQAAAKMWLSKIGPDAPADVLPAAKMQLGLIRMAEHDWAGAAGEWEQVRAVASLPPSQRAVSAYHLGLCRLNIQPPDTGAASKLFDEATAAEGPEGAAARVRLAELDLRSDEKAKHTQAAEQLATVVKNVNAPAEYTNTLVPIDELRAAFERAVQTLTTDAAFGAALSTVTTYKAVAVPGRDREKRAEVYAAWGATLKKDGGAAAPKFTAAAEEYVSLAEARSAETDKAEQFKRAAALYRQAENPTAAVATLERVIKLPKLPDDIAGPVWVEYAEGLLAARRSEDAFKAFQTAMNTSGPTSTAARYRVARLLIDSRLAGNVDLGLGLMDQIAGKERVEAVEQEQHERALVESAHEYVRKGNFAEAETRLSKQLKLYPTGSEAGLGKLLLGVCLLQRADPKAKPPAPNPARNREEALKLFQQVVAEVKARSKSDHAADRDSWLRVQAGIRIVQTYLFMTKPHDVLTEGDALRREFAGTVEELIVLSLMYHAFKQMDKPEGMLTLHGQMREVFDRIKDKPGVFWAKAGEYSRDYWEKVWFAPDPGPTK